MTEPEFSLFSADERRWFVAPRARDFLGAVAILGVTGLACYVTAANLPELAVALLLLMGVLICAARFGFWVGITSALIAFLMLDFFFVEPNFAFHIHHAHDFFALGVFLVAAALTGILAGRLREQVDAAEGRAQMLLSVASLSRELTNAGTLDAVIESTTRHLAGASSGHAIALTRSETGGLSVAAVAPAYVMPVAADLQAADSALRRRKTEFATAQGWDGSRFTFLPMRLEGLPDIAFGHVMIDDRRRDMIWREQAISATFRQTELALERLAYARAAADEARKAETETLRASVLSSLSHDLRTPLASILGAATTLSEFRHTLSEEAQADLIDTVTEEAERLRRYVDQLLHMTRLQAGLSAQLSWVDAGDVARAAAARAARAFPAAGIRADLPADLPMIRAEAGLLEQALFNLLENAARYAPGDVVLNGAAEDARLTLSVRDAGPGLPDGIRDMVNGKSRAGTHGLGLAIAGGIARLLGGLLRATDVAPQGARLSLILPIGEPEAVPGPDALK